MAVCPCLQVVHTMPMFGGGIFCYTLIPYLFHTFYHHLYGLYNPYYLYKVSTLKLLHWQFCKWAANCYYRSNFIKLCLKFIHVLDCFKIIHFIYSNVDKKINFLDESSYGWNTLIDKTQFIQRQIFKILVIKQD